MDMEQTRRDILLTGCASLFAAAAGAPAAWAQPAGPAPLIDCHAHIFNGRDIPVVGFLRQVIGRDAAETPSGGGLSAAALKLVKFILLSRTPSPAEELAELAGAPSAIRRMETALAEDQRAVAEGIARYRAELGRQTDGFSTTRAEEEALLDQIERELGLDDAGLALPGRSSEELAARIYAPPADPQALFRDSRLLQTIRWAGLLTRRRGDILDELIRTYGGAGGVQVFLPALVDFALWFRDSEEVSDIADQIAVVSALARRRDDAVILNFAPFCPLRAALDRAEGRDPLATLAWAVEDMGCAGVKLYPPLGFAPAGNSGAALDGLPRVPPGGGAALDAELEALYGWCVIHEVPVMAHANNSIDAGVCTALNASPARWAPVLQRFPLQLSLAHFGGFDEEATAAFCMDPEGTDWERQAAGLMAGAPNLYVDLSYWSEAGLPGAERRAEVVAKLRGLLAANPVLTERMLYGSDWTMLAREPRHEGYRKAVERALAEAGLDAAAQERVKSGNARRFLGLDRGGPQHARLSRFFGADHPFAELFAL